MKTYNDIVLEARNNLEYIFGIEWVDIFISDSHYAQIYVSRMLNKFALSAGITQYEIDDYSAKYEKFINDISVYE